MMLSQRLRVLLGLVVIALLLSACAPGREALFGKWTDPSLKVEWEFSQDSKLRVKQVVVDFEFVDDDTLKVQENSSLIGAYNLFGSVDFSISGDTLTLKYNNRTLKLTRVK